MRILQISDTHNKHQQLTNMPAADVIVHCGDFTEQGTEEETLLIYSSWDGYYKDPEQVKVNPKYKQFREMFHNIVDIHTSGHADRQTIEKVIKIVKPKEVICISFPFLFIPKIRKQSQWQSQLQ